MTSERVEALAALWGCGDLDVLFKGAPQVILPWPSAGRLKSEHRIGAADVEPLLAGPARLHEVDPRILFASQPWVLRSHASYYTTGEWEITGRTSADMHSFANRYPTFIERRGQIVIATGHHRSLVALIEGRPVLARIATRAVQPVVITPHLSISSAQPPSSDPSPDDVDQLVMSLQHGHPVSVANATVAAAVLGRVGLDHSEVEDRLRHSGLDSIS